MPSSSPTIGIIGLGNVGRFHADRLIDNGATVVGSDIDPDARTRFAESYATSAYEDVADLFADADGVLVATPNRYHEEYAVAALDAGLDVLLEKPVAHSL